MSDHDTLANCVEQGWTYAINIENPGGPSYRVFMYEEPPSVRARFEHRCDRGERGVIMCAPLIGEGHVVHQLNHPTYITVEPSIHCLDCGTHGFIRENRWVPA